MEKIYVQIMKAKLPTFWYINSIGDVFEVEKSIKHPNTDWELSTLSGYYIQKQDCKVVNMNKFPKEKTEGFVPEPPELEENWHENLIEPARWEIEIMDLAADELELSL